MTHFRVGAHPQRRWDWRRAAARPVLSLVAIVLACATGYEVAAALGWIPIGSVPGEGPAGGGAVFVAAVSALLVGSGALASAPGSEARLAPVVDLTAAAFVVARFYTFDPYYAPTLRRMSDAGFVAGSWVVMLVAAALVAAVVSIFRPRIGMRAGAVVSLLCALTAVAEGAGH